MSLPALPDPSGADSSVMRERVAKVAALFEAEAGPLRWPGRRDPLAGLVQTLLSHNTTDPNAFAAYDKLQDRYRGWEDIAQAPHGDVANVIRVAGLNNQKAERIQELLRFVKQEYGEYSADVLDGMEFDEAFATFSHLKGVKHKTLAVVLTFDLGKDVFAVDTHVHRVCQRIGFVPEKATAVKTFQRMNELVPEGLSYQFHIHLIRHGRKVCSARSPKCGECFVREMCRYGRSNV
ncbi:MAG TPA: endonuclease III [Bacteroidetes bacterium]|nr:endonuclease III [bacterium BMS3Bbin04]HDO66428.1 endonuclease III [Bacteroidota bacterium]HEX05553.1 endonuclease III [Bacteroidota bacterium]